MKKTLVYLSKRTTDYILQTIVGNEHLRRNLKSILHTYIGSINDISIKGPFVYIYLFGPPGTGKTTLISRLQEEINQDQYGLVRITMPEVRTLDDLTEQLQNASPLQGKTIFFDEFQALDNIKPVEEQNKVIEFLKLLFENDPYLKTINTMDLNVEEKTNDMINRKVSIKETYNLNFHNTIVAIATNIEISQMPCLIEKDNGQELRDKIYNFCKQLKMTSDLRDLIPDFVTKYTQNAFYKFTMNRHFGENTHVTARCQLHLSEDL